MKRIKTIVFGLIFSGSSYGQTLPPKQAHPSTITQIHSGHSLTDPLFSNWPGQYINLIANQNSLEAWKLFDVLVGKSTVPGSTIKARWENPPGFGAPDARLGIGNWQLLSITERVPLAYQGGNKQQWYLNQIQDQKEYLSLFVNNAWNNGNNGNGAPTLLWTTWTNIDDRDGPWRNMLDTQGAEFERMQDYANLNKPSNAPHVYIIPGHKMFAKLYDDIQLNLVPGITKIDQFFSDKIHTNELGAYAIALIHYACIFNQSPVGLPNNLLPNAASGTPIPSPELALYLQNMIWEVVTNYPRTGITNNLSAHLPESSGNSFVVYPNPATNSINIVLGKNAENQPVYIYDFLGKVFYSGYDKTIDINDFPDGLYLLKVGNTSKKFIKQ